MRKLTCLLLIAAFSLAASAAKKPKAPETPYTGYLFAYFEGTGDRFKQEQLRFAISRDGTCWRTLNRNWPIIASDTISTSGGIRDPHILRGEDGCFYMVATDMNTMRDGWRENPGIVMLKSRDLIDWTHSKVVLAKDFAEHFSDAYWVWAPQTIYDRKAGKYMIYFTLQRTNDNRQSMVTYYAYANSDFTGFESEPKVLFRAKYSCLDNDIIEHNGTYHMFYKGNIKNAEGKEIQNGIQKATAKKLLGPWKEDFKFIDAYADSNTGVEGSGVFKLNPPQSSNPKSSKSNLQPQFVLMYDLYGSGRYEYQTSSDLRTFSKTPLSFDKDFHPRHGTVISLTEEEMERLQKRWGYVLTDESLNSNKTKQKWSGNPILPEFHADPEVLYDRKTNRYYIYSTTDGQPGWGGWYFTCFSSADLTEWRYEGVVLDLPKQTKWARGNAWAPAAIERNGKYYLYYSGDEGRQKAIGVAIADSPTGPFKDFGQPIVNQRPKGQRGGQQIDVDVFLDDDGQAYLYWGNGYMAGAKLNDDMTSIDTTTVTLMTPRGGTLRDYAFREGAYVIKRNGIYYFLWSVDDTGSPNYHVAYGTSKSPLGPIEVAAQPVILQQRPDENIFGTAHNSVLQIPGRDEWYVVYHRINPTFIDREKGPGIHRQVCIDRMEFDADGRILPITPTHKGVRQIDN